MKKILLILIFLFLTINIYAFGEKNIIIDFTKAQITNGEIKDNILNFSSSGEISFYANLLKDRVYTLSLEGDTINCEGNITFIYKYANIKTIKQNFTNKFIFTCPLRIDNTKITLKILNPCKINKISLDVETEPLLYGCFIIPQYKNIVKNQKNIFYRYISNHEELGKEDSKINLIFSIKDSGGNVKWTKTQKGIVAKDLFSFDNPKLSEGNYTFTVESKEGDTSLSTFTCDYIVSNISDNLYPDENGRLLYKNNLFILLGAMGNYDKSKNIGLNSYIDKDNSLFINEENTNIKVFMPQGKINNDTFKDINKNTLTICDNVDTSLFGVINSYYFGLNIKNNIYDNIKTFFDDYGFYYPLINVVNIDENLDTNFWENFAQTQTGLIFNFKDPNDIEKIKPYIDFIKKYENIILSNQENKTYVYGNIKYLIRRVEKSEYVFLFETRGKESEVDILVPNKKNKVYEGENLINPNKKNQKDYSLKIKPKEIKVIKIEL